jgi:LysM repeat protein
VKALTFDGTRAYDARCLTFRRGGYIGGRSLQPYAARDKSARPDHLTSEAGLPSIALDTLHDLKERITTMADQRFEQLKMKYQSVINFIQAQNANLQNVNMEGDKLLIRASAPSQDVKNRIWDQIKLVDPSYADLTADIQAPAAAAAAAAAAGAAPAAGQRTYTVQAGDSLSKISQHFYGNANQYMKIFEANKDKLADPDKVRAGMELNIP